MYTHGSSCGDLEQMLDSDTHFSDVLILVGTERRPIRAHKNILSLRSPVFRAMFQADMSERHSSQVHISDLDYAVVMELLRYLYARRVRDMDAICAELLVAADKYGVEDLKVMCQKSACKQLREDNVLRLLEVATLCRVETLKQLCSKFIVKRQQTIFKTPEFGRLGAGVVRELCETYAKMLYREESEEKFVDEE